MHNITDCAGPAIEGTAYNPHACGTTYRLFDAVITVYSEFRLQSTEPIIDKLTSVETSMPVGKDKPVYTGADPTALDDGVSQSS